jgi:hypothetical protein
MPLAVPFAQWGRWRLGRVLIQERQMKQMEWSTKLLIAALLLLLDLRRLYRHMRMPGR